MSQISISVANDLQHSLRISTSTQSSLSSQNSLSFRGGGGTVPDFTELQLQLNQAGLYMIDVESDGNCMYRAVSEQLENDDQSS